MKELNIAFRPTISKPLLRQNQVEKRLQWATEHKEYDWDRIIFSDESSFWVGNTLKRAWSEKGGNLIQRSVKHPAKLHVWGCFSKLGFGKLIIFSQNLDAQFMRKIYQRGLLPSANMWYGKDNRNWCLQEDNDPKHRSRLCRAWKEENDVDVLDWPSQSPDANPIENVWSIIKHRLRGKQICTIEQLRRHIKRIWKALPLSYAEKLVESMPSRCDAIIKNGGDWTLY